METHETFGAELMQAAFHGDLDAVMRMLPKADLSCRDPLGNTALILAAGGGAASDACALALMPGSEIDARNDMGWSALMWAAFSGRLAVAEGLIARGAFIELRDKRGRGALHHAAEAGEDDSVECARALRACGADPNAVDDDGVTPLMVAAMGGNPKFVEAFARGCDLGLRDMRGDTALDHAAACSRQWSRILPRSAPLARQTEAALRAERDRIELGRCVAHAISTPGRQSARL